jgi:hypothetical protein
MNRSKVSTKGLTGHSSPAEPVPNYEKSTAVATQPFSKITLLKMEQLSIEQQECKTTIVSLINQNEVIPERLTNRYNHIFSEILACKRYSNEDVY